MTDTLKPCPFCGEAAKIGINDMDGRAWPGFAVECDECRAQGPEAPSESDAMKAWNDRAAASGV